MYVGEFFENSAWQYNKTKNGGVYMIRVVCYGDSNTWGYNPVNEKRYSEDERWTYLLKGILGDKYEVIEEGLSGRTTVIDDFITPYRSGREYLYPCLESHYPLDLVVIMLGTNDLKTRFSFTARDIALGAGKLVEIVKNSTFGRDGKAPEVLLICPPIAKEIGDFAESFKGAGEKSSKLPSYYKQVSEEHNCYFLDITKDIISSDVDGIHLDIPEHKKLAELVGDAIKEIFE